MTNEALSVKIEATNGILSRVEKKVDDLAVVAINPQVFELKVKELQVGIAQNTVDILGIKKDMAKDKEASTEKAEGRSLRQSNNAWSLVRTILGTGVGVLVGYLLTR